MTMMKTEMKKSSILTQGKHMPVIAIVAELVIYIIHKSVRA